MSDASANGDATEGAAPAAAQLPKMQILGQFIRDLSFENAAVQYGTATQGQPDIQVQVALDARKRTVDNQYDVIMKLKIESKTKDEDAPKSIFLIELEYGGVFLIENIAEQQLHPFLMIECPRMLFPFVRRIISDMTRDGGYPPLNLDQIDFVALYRQQIAARQAQQPVGTA
ncbi:protein-export chaperone SecB [Jannaschia sp. CCS1]|uniref:Protein-export protein SecB n=1 Tax=Jannaschia sp. (strain CCS1) TaxID=290400 RepID=SECB_JANSC|nr:protein-export chaperone SecB [Jannaschia sp. CCS1]Q28W02.1 RecName: Full=Protein-export protein SecB [Jannaschia sp. CCS1]ABD53110.1 protein translocase subunit secB [Jannaschia sp. CCS1]